MAAERRASIDRTIGKMLEQQRERLSA